MMILQLLALCSIHSHGINLLEILVELLTNVQHLLQQIISYRPLQRHSKRLSRPRRILNLPAQLAPRKCTRRGRGVPSVQLFAGEFEDLGLANYRRRLIDAIHHAIQNPDPRQPQEILPNFLTCSLV